MHPGGAMMGGFPQQAQQAPPQHAMHPMQMQAAAAMQHQQQGTPMPMHGMMPLGPAAMPAQQGQVFEFLPGVASLVEDLDKRVLVTLRDGRHFVGASPPIRSPARRRAPIVRFVRLARLASQPRLAALPPLRGCLPRLNALPRAREWWGRNDAVFRPVRKCDAGRHI